MARILDPEFAEGAKKLTRGAAKSVSNVSKKHPTIPVGVGAYVMGAKHGMAASENQNAYGDTYNKGRAVNKHPYSGSYYG